jgi:hypothetical protein
MKNCPPDSCKSLLQRRPRCARPKSINVNVPGAAVGTRSRSIVTLRQMTQGDASRANKINGDKGDVASNDASPNFPGERAAKQFDRAQHRRAGRGQRACTQVRCLNVRCGGQTGKQLLVLRRPRVFSCSFTITKSYSA